jgi:hypothetical protein
VLKAKRETRGETQPPQPDCFFTTISLLLGADWPTHSNKPTWHVLEEDEERVGARLKGRVDVAHHVAVLEALVQLELLGVPGGFRGFGRPQALGFFEQ